MLFSEFYYHVSGGWWSATCFEDIKGDIALEMGPNMFMYSQDNGLFKLGDPHTSGK